MNEHMNIFLFKMTDTITSQNIDLSSWVLYTYNKNSFFEFQLRNGAYHISLAKYKNYMILDDDVRFRHLTQSVTPLIDVFNKMMNVIMITEYISI